MREFSDVVETTWKRNLTIFGEKYIRVDVNGISVQTLEYCLDIHEDIFSLQEVCL
jgi:hypothetical protein